MNNNDKNVFDIKAATWDDNPQRADMAKAIAERIKQTLPLNKNIEAMDFGCGTGLVSVFLAGLVKSITAVDTSRQMLKMLADKLAKNHIDNITTRYADLTAQVDLNERFDLIFSSMAFHHIEDPSALLRKFFNLLRKGGRFAVSDLDKEDGSFHRDIKAAHHGFDRDEFSNWLKQAGFMDITTQTAHVMNRTDSQGVLREYSIFLITAVKK